MSDLRDLIARALPFALSPPVLAELADAAQLVEALEGDLIYESGATANALYIVREGTVLLKPSASGAPLPSQAVQAGEAFGWTALGGKAGRRYRAVAVTAASLLRIDGNRVLDLAAAEARDSNAMREHVAGALQDIRHPENQHSKTVELALYRLAHWLRSPAPYLGLIGYALLLGFWYLSVEVLKLPRFAEMPGLTQVLQEWLSRDPTYGVSIHTPVYYQHILVSVQRIAIAFTLATVLGVPFGLMLGWSRAFKDYLFPLFEMVRPIPILAWVPLAIIMFPGSELPVIFLTFLASFYATALNTMLGVKSIDKSYVLAASCLGASKLQIFRHVIVPGAMPFIFTGLQISVGVAWFSLVAAEMVSGQFGLGYLINTSYTTVEYPTIVIAMLTLGIVGYLTSALVRIAGDWAMRARARQLAMEA
jgi:ABC-type nitrate/sulfonate/bicarbonate transport system permease component/CRP-like cAMP-binding protein